MSDDRHADLGAVADTLMELMGTFNKRRAVLIQEAEDDVEWLGHLILHTLNGLGPARASALAECLHLDKASVSRQVTTLTRDGLLERHDDPADGRASILDLTDAGRAAVSDLERRRREFFDRTLADWSDADVARFQRLLARFVADFGDAHNRWMADRQSARDEHRRRTEGVSR